jgi:ribonuclease HII
MKYIAGVDEAGRGPLVGSVVAAAVILDPKRPISGLADSKKLTEKKREALYPLIIERALAYAIAEASAAEIDQFNILQATLIAMTRAVDGLSVRPDHVLVDGNRLPKWPYSAEAIVKGDAKEACISAASILAKVTRDKAMRALHLAHPEYGFADHKGYPTVAHLAALTQHGPLAEHRRSFGPVKLWLSQGDLFD